jgi:hypothetical protein
MVASITRIQSPLNGRKTRKMKYLGIFQRRHAEHDRRNTEDIIAGITGKETLRHTKKKKSKMWAGYSSFKMVFMGRFCDKISDFIKAVQSPSASQKLC